MLTQFALTSFFSRGQKSDQSLRSLTEDRLTITIQESAK